MMRIEPANVRRVVVGLIIVFICSAMVLLGYERLSNQITDHEILVPSAFTLLTIGVSLFLVNILIQNAQTDELRRRARPALQEIRDLATTRMSRILAMLSYILGGDQIDSAISHARRERTPLHMSVSALGISIVEPTVSRERLVELIQVCREREDQLDREVREAYLFVGTEDTGLKTAFRRVVSTPQMLLSTLEDAGEEVDSLGIWQPLCELYDAWWTLSRVAEIDALT